MDEKELFEYQRQMDECHPERIFTFVCLASIAIGVIAGIVSRFL